MAKTGKGRKKSSRRTKLHRLRDALDADGDVWDWYRYEDMGIAGDLLQRCVVPFLLMWAGGLIGYAWDRRRMKLRGDRIGQ